MKLTRILLITILILTTGLFAIIWVSPDYADVTEIEEALIFAGNISEDEKQAWLEKYNQGLELVENEDFAAAIEVFENAITIDPDNGEAYHQIAKAYDQIGLEENALWYYKAATFLYEGNPISEFKFEMEQETTNQTENTVPEETAVSAGSSLAEITVEREASGWEEAPLRLSKAVRYVDGALYEDYSIHYDENNRITDYVVNSYWDGTGEITYTDIWEFTYDNAGNVLKEYNPTSDSKIAYEYSYLDGKPTQCKMIVEGVEYRRFMIGTDARGHVLSVDGEGVYDTVYGFEIDYTYGSDMVPIRAIGSLTMSHGTTGKLFDYTYHPALMQVDVIYKNEGKNDNTQSFFRIDNFDILHLPEFYMKENGSFEVNEEGYVTKIFNDDGSVYWELSYESKTDYIPTNQSLDNRRIARVNEYNSKGVIETNTFNYDKEGRLESYTTTYYNNGKPADKDIWTFDYYDDGKLFGEYRDRGDEDYLSYIHIRDEGIEGYQTLYGKGIQQQFYYEFNSDGTIVGIRGEGIHDYFFKSNMTYSYDKRNGIAYSVGSLTGTENAEYRITKNYDFSYTGVVLIEDNTMLNGSELPISRYLRIDMPEYIGLPEIVFYGSDEIITDDDGYIVKILDKSGALRCELIFDYC